MKSGNFPFFLLASKKVNSFFSVGHWSVLVLGCDRGEAGKPPAPAVDALLKAGLLASQLLVSPNNLREKKESSLAIFYVNEVSYALELLAGAPHLEGRHRRHARRLLRLGHLVDGQIRRRDLLKRRAV